MAEVVLTAGARRLRAWLDAPGCPYTQVGLANLLGVSQQAVSNWLRGEGAPSALLREAVERVSGIAAPLWLTEEQARELAAIETRARAS